MHQASRPITTALLAAALLLAPACGHHYDDDGNVFLDNQTQTTTNDNVDTFQIARFGDPFTGDLLGGSPVPPGSARFIGEFEEDFYDATSQLSPSGDIYDWPDVFVYADETTFFEVF